VSAACYLSRGGGEDGRRKEETQPAYLPPPSAATARWVSAGRVGGGAHGAEREGRLRAPSGSDVTRQCAGSFALDSLPPVAFSFVCLCDFDFALKKDLALCFFIKFEFSARRFRCD
jgi:hypothetical protein